MTWNYRVLRHVDSGMEYYGLHEVYYNGDGSIAAWTEDSILVGEDFGEIAKAVKMIANDLEKHPIVIDTTVVEPVGFEEVDTV